MVSRAPSQTDRRWRAARDWDRLRTEVRAEAGNEGFLGAWSSDELREAAGDGVVIVVNASQWRCDALVVERTSIQAVELPLLTRTDAVRVAETMVTALRQFDAAVDAFNLSLAHIEVSRSSHSDVQHAALARRAAQENVNSVLLDTLAWLWMAIIESLLPHLPKAAGPGLGERPRVWWCLTGPLALLPIHAAGRYRGGPDRMGDSGTWLIDRVVSSYAPTLRSLAELRRRIRDDAGLGAGQCLMVAPAAEAPDSTHADSSVDFGIAGARTVRLVGGEATVAKVKDELTLSRWVHFDTHAEQDLREPSLGSLVLADGRIGILELAAMTHDGDFAGLAACQTAQGGIDVPDEVITVASALHYTGYRHVVASLWSLGDSTAAAVFGDLYKGLSQGGRFEAERAARALDAEVRGLKDAHPDVPHVWASLIHIGL